MDTGANENLEIDISEVVIHEKDDNNLSNFILTTKPIEVVRIAKPDSDNDDDNDEFNWVIWEQKWCCLELESALKKCSLTEVGILNINLENLENLFKFSLKRLV